jgi:hypothetical protein
VTSPEPRLPVPEDDDLDAAVSAVVDGVATPEEAALVAAAPDGGARVEAVRAVAGAVRTLPGAQDPAAAERAMATALAAFDTIGSADAAVAGATPRVAGGGPATARRAEGVVTQLPVPPPASGSGRGRRVVGIAAALLLLLGVGTFAVGVLGRDGSDDTMAAAPQVSREAAADAASGGTGYLGGATESLAGPTAPPSSAARIAGPASPEAGTASLAAPPVVDGGAIGRQEDVDVLAQRAAAALDGVPDAAVSPPGAAAPSDIQACITAAPKTAAEGLKALRYRATGSFQDVPAVFLAYDRLAQPPPRILLVMARSGCTILATAHF